MLAGNINEGKLGVWKFINNNSGQQAKGYGIVDILKATCIINAEVVKLSHVQKSNRKRKFRQKDIVE